MNKACIVLLPDGRTWRPILISLLLAAKIVLLPAATLTFHSATAAAQTVPPSILRMEPEIVRALVARVGPAIQNRMIQQGITDPVAIRTAIQHAVRRMYPAVMQGIGQSMRRAAGVTTSLSRRALYELGATLHDFPPVRDAVAGIIRRGNFKNAGQLAAHLWRGNLYQIIAARVPQDFTNMATKIAYELSESSAGRGAIRRAIATSADSGLGAALRRWAARVGAGVSTIGRWFLSSTLFELLLLKDIATISADQVKAAVTEYQSKAAAQAGAHAAELVPFSNNIRLLVRSLRSGRTCLADGLTIPQAIRLVQKNTKRGGNVFHNVLRRRGAGVPCPKPVSESKADCACKVSTALLGDKTKGCSAYAEKHDRKGRNMTFHIVDNIRRFAGWKKPSHWGSGVGRPCDELKKRFDGYCQRFCR